MDFTHRRAVNIIRETISDLQVDLSDFEVLTEVGSNNYLYTPIIAALAGARKVNAWTTDSRYGNGVEIKAACLAIAKQLGKDKVINIEINTRPTDQISSADIITNSGFLRPLDEAFVKLMKPSAVIPLMYEAWEFRGEDVDAASCLRHGIKIAGTWEGHPDIKVFENVRALAVKLAMEAGYEIAQNKIVVWSNDDFGKEAMEGFRRFEPKLLKLTTNVDEVNEIVDQLDFIFICDYHEERPYFQGANSIFNIDKVVARNNRLGIVHLYGDIDYDQLTGKSIPVYPKKNGRSKIMSETLAYLGLLPVIKLQTAGFKVAESLLKDKPHTLSQIIKEAQ